MLREGNKKTKNKLYIDINVCICTHLKQFGLFCCKYDTKGIFAINLACSRGEQRGHKTRKWKLRCHLTSGNFHKFLLLKILAKIQSHDDKLRLRALWLIGLLHLRLIFPRDMLATTLFIYLFIFSSPSQKTSKAATTRTCSRTFYQVLSDISMVGNSTFNRIEADVMHEAATATRH